ncbi:MAG: SDR family NAD(P)-dependent oxidoreductase [Candidatus Humimicrobiaceae bacterium]
MKTIDLKGQVSLIVGGAGDIGGGITEALAEAGSTVVIADIDDERAASLKNKIKSKSCPEPFYYRCDLTDKTAVKNTVFSIINEVGPINNLVYSAGYSSFAEFIELTDIEWERSMAINLYGAFYFIREYVRQMMGEKLNVILIGSTTTINGSGGGAHYASSKIGLLGLMKSVTYDLLSKGVRVNTISPGVIDTKMLRIRYPDTPEVNKKITDGIPLGRMGSPEDIGNIAVFLASEMSGYICGQEIIVDGGRIIYRRPK